MGASLHVADVDQQQFHDDPGAFLRDYLFPPFCDVTYLRDNFDTSAVQMLYRDLDPKQMRTVAVLLERHSDSSVQKSYCVAWLRAWADSGHGIKGMH